MLTGFMILPTIALFGFIFYGVLGGLSKVLSLFVKK